MTTADYASFFQNEGYVLVKGLFSPEETAHLRDHYTEMRKKPTDSDDLGFPAKGEQDPLKLFPRIMQPHRFDALSKAWMLDPRLRDTLTALLGAEPIAGQTMVYFKPAGARGQALHQDQFYLRVSPGTCVAAWMALDPCDDENGCIQVVPGTQNFPVVCPTSSDLEVSFTDVTTPLPEGLTPVPVHMEAGDVLFFNGSIVHGSGPNISKDRFRRALIGHYITADAREVSIHYKPALRFDGTEAEIGGVQSGGPCGVWVTRDGIPELEMVSGDSDRELVLH